MRTAGDLQGPVGYDDRWVWLAVGAVAVVVLYYALVWWWGRPRRVRPAVVAAAAPRRTSVSASRREALARLDAIEGRVAAGEISARDGHRHISETVRAFVADATGVPAPTMTLDDLRRGGHDRVAAVVALVYAPEFGPGGELPRERFAPVLAEARGLVRDWE